MKKVNNDQKYFLALMRRPGDYIFIQVSKLDISNGLVPIDLGDIDSFTMHFSKEEIMNSIKRANIAQEEYLNGSLVIQDNQKHNPLPVIDKEYYNNFQIDQYLKKNINDKMFVNTLINKFKTYNVDEVLVDTFNTSLKKGNINLALNVLFSIEYTDIRKFIIYLLDYRDREIEKEKNKELIRDKIA